MPATSAPSTTVPSARAERRFDDGRALARALVFELDESIRKLPGAIVGGLIIGIVEALAGFYLPEGFKDIAPYIVVLIMLVLKPNGLFGEKLRKKV